MRGRFRRKRDSRREAIEQALSVLESTRGRLGMSRAERRGRAYGAAIGVGVGILLMLMLISLSFWLLRRRARETTPTTSVVEEGEEVTLPVPEEEEEEEVVVEWMQMSVELWLEKEVVCVLLKG